MSTSRLDPRRLRQIRDALLRYVYEHGADGPGWSVPASDVSRALAITRDELRAAVRLAMNQGLISNRCPAESIGLSLAGQDEAERLGPEVLMRSLEAAPPSQVIAINSVVQFAGANSRQSAHLSIQQQVSALLDEIDRTLPALPIDERSKDKARRLLTGLKDALSRGLEKVVVQALAAPLADLLSAGGSDLGRRLLGLLTSADS